MSKRKKLAGKAKENNLSKSPKGLELIKKKVKDLKIVSGNLDFSLNRTNEVVTYELTSSEATHTGNAIHNTNRLIPIVSLKSGFGMYLSISYTSKTVYSYKFKSISIQFFDFNGHLIFRAEIGDDSDNSRISHPQPHWHLAENKIIGSNQDQFVDIVNQNGFISGLNTSSADEIGDIDLSRIHFLMNYEHPITTENWDEVKVVDWLDKTLKSVCSELDFVSPLLRHSK